MTIYDIAYKTHYSGCVQVEADSPEQSVEIFTDMLKSSTIPPKPITGSKIKEFTHELRYHRQHHC